MEHKSPLLARAALASALLLSILCVMTLVLGVSQQSFEWASPPPRFSEDLRRAATAIRAIVVVDDVFIAAYVTSGLMLARRLSRPANAPFPLLVGAGTVLAGLLDLEENHHLLAMTELATRDVTIPLEEILGRSDRSQLKWMIGHVSFVFAGLLLGRRGAMTRVLGFSLVALQLPIGALTWAAPEGPMRSFLLWVRYASFIAGFALFAFLARDPDGLVEADSDAPA